MKSVIPPYEPISPSIQTADHEHKPKSPLTSSDKLGVLILLVLYFIQGIPLGFFDATIPFLLIDKGAEFSALGLLSFFSYPFSMKILFAPFEDAHFSMSFGKRKSYIIPCQYLLALLFFISGVYIEGLVNDKSIFTLTVIGFSMTMLAALQDIAVDGWQLTLLEESQLVWGSVAQSIGQTIGNIFASSVFIQLNSIGLINIRSFCFLVGGLIFLITLLVHLFKSEKNPANSHEKVTVWEVVKSLKGFFKNNNLKFLIFHLLFWRLGFSIVGNTVNVNLIKKGLSKETLMSILTALIPFSFLVSFLAGRMNGKGHEMKIYLKLYLLKILDNIILFLLVTYYNNTTLYLIVFAISNAYSTMIQSGMFVLYGGFANRISDADVGGTYLTFLNSMHNLGNMWTASLSYYLVAIFDYKVLVGLSWMVAIGYYIIFRRRIEAIGMMPKQAWSLKVQ